MKIRDAIVPYHPKDRDTVRVCLKSLKFVLGVERVFLVCSEDQHIPRGIFVDERNATSLLSIEQIRGHVLPGREGWIFQQLLKLGAPSYIPDLSDVFMVCDSDIIFLVNPYAAIPDGKVPWSKAFDGSVHRPYWDHFLRLMQMVPPSEFSFINHHAIWHKEAISSFLDSICERNSKPWDRAIVDCLDANEQSGFSEYNFVGQMYQLCLRDGGKGPHEVLVEVPIRIKNVKHLPTQHDVSQARSEGYHILSSQQWSRK